MGGMNIASEYFYGGTTRVDAVSGRPGWRDTDVEVVGPAVNDIVTRYLAVMAWQQGVDAPDPALVAKVNPPQPPAGDARVRFVWNHPALGNEHHIERLWEAYLDVTPKGNVARIETAYFAPGPILRKALKRALARGARVVVLSNSDETNDIKMVADATHYAYYALLGLPGIVALFERKPRPDIGELVLHSKVASFGTCGPAVIGSANMDGQSGEHNTESVVAIWDPTLRKEFDAMYEQDLAPDRTHRVTMKDYESSDAWQWLKRTGLYYLAWYWL